MTDWPSEEIPDDNRLFMRVHERWRDDSGIAPAAFRNHNDGMSTDWEKYSVAQETRLRARVPAKNAVVSLLAGEVRCVPGQNVQHTPDVENKNRAHTDVFGDKDVEARLKLRRIAKVEIAFDTPVD